MIDLLSMSVHHIDVVAQEGLGEEEWRCMGYYGRLEIHIRHLSWSLLTTLMTHLEIPWL